MSSLALIQNWNNKASDCLEAVDTEYSTSHSKLFKFTLKWEKKNQPLNNNHNCRNAFWLKHCCFINEMILKTTPRHTMTGDGFCTRCDLRDGRVWRNRGMVPCPFWILAACPAPLPKWCHQRAERRHPGGGRGAQVGDAGILYSLLTFQEGEVNTPKSFRGTKTPA